MPKDTNHKFSPPARLAKGEGGGGSVRERLDCRLCGSRSIENIWNFGPTPLANSYLTKDQLSDPEITAPLTVGQCQSCHLVQLRHVVDPKVLFADYLYVSSTSPKFMQHFADYADHLISRFQLASEDLVIDIGSNDGVLLKPFKQKNIKTLGVEPAKNIAALANEQGLETIPEFFTPEIAKQIVQTKQAVYPAYAGAKIITANNVFAHTDDLQLFTKAVKAALASDGVFVFEVQYLGDLLAKNLFDIIYHEHLCYYHAHPLVSFFESHQLDVFDVERPQVHGGSIRVYVQKQNGPYAHSERLSQILQEEEQNNLNSLVPYKSFSARVNHNKKLLQNLLSQLKKTGAKIVGYGAPAKATTLLYAFDIKPDTLDFIVDDDQKFKQGRYMPGRHIPIVSPDQLYQAKPDYCLILAWNFAEPIMQNHQKFVAQGGRFIVPVPEPVIINP